MKGQTIQKADLDWKNLPFSYIKTDYNIRCYYKNGKWSVPELTTEETLQMLINLAQNPEKLTNPFELGEILFVSGNFKEAAIFYSEALKRKDMNDVNTSLDRAWILFQIGNCQRNDDMPSAAKMYQQLLTEYPNSPWAPLATARNNLIAWYLRDEPLKLMAEVKHAGSELDTIR